MFVWDFALLSWYYQIIIKSAHKKNNFILTTQATLKHLLSFEICARDIYEKFVYKPRATDYVEKWPTF